MDLGITGKTALVLGASQGIGRAIAETLAQEGADVVLVARDAGALETIAADMARKHGVTATPCPVDLSDPQAVAEFCTRVENEFKPDMLVNNAGGPPPSASSVWAFPNGMAVSTATCSWGWSAARSWRAPGPAAWAPA